MNKVLIYMILIIFLTIFSTFNNITIIKGKDNSKEVVLNESDSTNKEESKKEIKEETNEENIVDKKEKDILKNDVNDKNVSQNLKDDKKEEKDDVDNKDVVVMYDDEKDKENINSLLNNHLLAFRTADIELLNKTTTKENIIKKDILTNLAKKIEKYEDISINLLKLKNNDYIALITYNIKFKGSDIVLPEYIKYYVSNVNGEYKIDIDKTFNVLPKVDTNLISKFNDIINDITKKRNKILKEHNELQEIVNK